MAKKVDPIKAKAKRDKIVAGVLGGLLLIVSIFAVPMTLKQWKKLNGGNVTEAAPAQTTTTPAPGSPPAALPTLPGDGSGIAQTVSAPVATGELHSFDLFESKDPFDQQVDVSVAPSVGTTAGPPRSTPSGGGGPVVPPAPPAPVAPRAPPVAPTSAVMSVNGAPAELLGVGVQFPLPPAEPLFQLVSLVPGRARIAIVGGAYASGDATITVKVGKPLTLENTADGTRYELRLLWVGAGTPPPGLVPAAPTAAAPTATPSTPSSTP